MAIKLATVADLKTLLNVSGAQDDARLDLFLQVVSTRVETYLNRELKDDGLVQEFFDGGKRIYSLKRFPIKSIPALVLFSDTGRDFDPTSIVDVDSYTVYLNEGYLEVDFRLPAFPRSVRADYEGGFTETAGVLEVPDAIDHATLLQTATLWQRKKELTMTSVGTDLGNIGFGPPPVDLIPEVKRALDHFRRRTLGYG